jgi:hypothetical protein
MTMRNLSLGAALGFFALASLAATPSSAATFDFSYTFDTKDVVTGSFTGTKSGDLISNIANVDIELNGQAFVGDPDLVVSSYTAAGSDCASCWTSGGAVVSSDPMKNNFFFSDKAPNSGASNYFYMVPWPNGGGDPEAVQAWGPSGVIDSYNGDLIPTNWSVTEVMSGGVPEPTTWALIILGLGMIGASLRVRRVSPALA